MKASIIGSVLFAVSALASPFAHGPDDDDHTPPAKTPELKSASETATAAGLTALVAALTKSGLAATVDGLKDVTIFAPTNEAFAKVASTTSGLGKEALGDILKYHIVKKVIKSTDLKTGDKVPTLYGPIITVTLAEKKVLINKATVVKADVPFKGGIVHVIDAVLTPPPKN